MRIPNSVTCNTLVWLREQPFEKGTTFTVVDEPKGDKDVDLTTAAAWERNGWLLPAGTKGEAAAAGEGA